MRLILWYLCLCCWKYLNLWSFGLEPASDNDPITVQYGSRLDKKWSKFKFIAITCQPNIQLQIQITERSASIINNDNWNVFSWKWILGIMWQRLSHKTDQSISSNAIWLYRRFVTPPQKYSLNKSMLTLENRTEPPPDEETVGISGVDCTIGLVLFLFSIFIIAGRSVASFL